MKERLHFLDAGRALFMMLGIPYHAALIYDPLDAWSVSSSDTSWSLAFLSMLLNYFRMPAFFIIAGFFSGMMLLRKRQSDWISSRFIRLGVPFLFAALLLNPLQMVASSISDAYHLAPSSLHEELTTFGPQWIRHLWFLPTLLLLSCLTAVAWPKIKPVLLATSSRLSGKGFAYVLILFATFSMVVGCATATAASVGPWDLKMVGGLIDFRSMLIYLPFFLFGVFCSIRDENSVYLTSVSLPLAAVGLILFVPFVIFNYGEGNLEKLVKMACWAGGGLLLAQCIIACLSRVFTRSSQLVDTLVLASFSIYLFHQPIISLLGALLLHIDLPPWLEFAGICIVTSVVALLLHMCVQSSKLLTFAFNGTTKSKTA